MRKIAGIFAIMCCITMVACSAEKEVFGEVMEVLVDQVTGTEVYVVQTEEKEDIGIIMGGSSYLIPWTDEFDEEVFQAGTQTGVIVSAACDRAKKTITINEGKEIPAYQARRVSVTGILHRNAMQLSDGTPVDILKDSTFGRIHYRLPDGMELLMVSGVSGPDNVYVIGLESFDDLSEPAKDSVLAFYEEQGLLYDVEYELERAYAAYLECDEEDFDSHLTGQDTSPSASTDRVMYFRTIVTHPIDGKHIYEEQLGAAFDRETGEYISNLALFTCPEEEVLTRLLDIAGVTDSILRKEMETAFKPEYMVFSEGNLEIQFTQGTLPSQEHSYFVAMDYDERLCSILHDWAVPEVTVQEEP